MREYIEAREGYVLTDGEVYGKIIYLAEGVDKASFKEITEEEHDAIQEEQAEEQYDGNDY